jgi:hypothetical protein
MTVLLASAMFPPASRSIAPPPFGASLPPVATISVIGELLEVMFPPAMTAIEPPSAVARRFDATNLPLIATLPVASIWITPAAVFAETSMRERLLVAP